MQRITKFLFPSLPSPTLASVIILIARGIFGFMFLKHGIEKLQAYNVLSATFPDQLGVGSETSLLMLLFAEVVCCIAFILGFLSRILMLPMIFAMFVAVFIIHAGDPISVREPGIIFLAIFIILYISGPGYFSIDALLRRIVG